MLRPFLFFLISFVVTSAARAGAWLQNTGEGMAIVSGTYFTSDSFFDEAGNSQPQDRFRKHEMQAYGEFGATKDWTVGANLFLNRVAQSGEQNIGIADSEFFARRQLYRTDDMVISTQPLIKLPSLYRESNPPLGGSRSADGELSVLAGFAMPVMSSHDYLDTRVAYRARSKGLSSQFRGDIALGMYLRPDILLVPAIRSITSIHPDETNAFREDGEQDYDLLKTEIALHYQVSETDWLQLTAFQHSAGALAGAGVGVSIGLGRKF